MNNSQHSNYYRQLANNAQARANRWLEMAKNKSHHKAVRISAAKQYRNCVKDVAKYKEMAEKYS